MTRKKLEISTWPRPALVLGQVPDPACLICDGDGAVIIGGSDEPDYEACDCWDPTWKHQLLPIPRWALDLWHQLRRHPGYSEEPPF